MVERNHQFSKAVWREKVWGRAWELEDVYWQTQLRVCKNLDIIHRTSRNCMYLTWWYLSDRFPLMMKVCETLARLVCHASLLKIDDVRLERLNRSHRTCSLCDLYEEDNVRHLVMECPTLQNKRSRMFNELRTECGRDGDTFLDNHSDVLGVLLGGCSDDIPQNQMISIWMIAGKHINHMYLKLRKGVG